jgi:hypothetical protein
LNKTNQGDNPILRRREMSIEKVIEKYKDQCEELKLRLKDLKESQATTWEAKDIGGLTGLSIKIAQVEAKITTCSWIIYDLKHLEI